MISSQQQQYMSFGVQKEKNIHQGLRRQKPNQAERLQGQQQAVQVIVNQDYQESLLRQDGYKKHSFPIDQLEYSKKQLHDSKRPLRAQKQVYANEQRQQQVNRHQSLQNKDMKGNQVQLPPQYPAYDVRQLEQNQWRQVSGFQSPQPPLPQPHSVSPFVNSFPAINTGRGFSPASIPAFTMDHQQQKNRDGSQNGHPNFQTEISNRLESFQHRLSSLTQVVKLLQKYSEAKDKQYQKYERYMLDEQQRWRKNINSSYNPYTLKLNEAIPNQNILLKQKENEKTSKDQLSQKGHTHCQDKFKLLLAQSVANIRQQIQNINFKPNVFVNDGIRTENKPFGRQEINLLRDEFNLKIETAVKALQAHVTHVCSITLRNVQIAIPSATERSKQTHFDHSERDPAQLLELRHPGINSTPSFTSQVPLPTSEEIDKIFGDLKYEINKVQNESRKDKMFLERRLEQLEEVAAIVSHNRNHPITSISSSQGRPPPVVTHSSPHLPMPRGSQPPRHQGKHSPIHSYSNSPSPLRKTPKSQKSLHTQQKAKEEQLKAALKRAKDHKERLRVGSGK